MPDQPFAARTRSKVEHIFNFGLDSAAGCRFVTSDSLRFRIRAQDEPALRRGGIEPRDSARRSASSSPAAGSFGPPCPAGRGRGRKCAQLSGLLRWVQLYVAGVRTSRLSPLNHADDASSSDPAPVAATDNHNAGTKSNCLPIESGDGPIPLGHFFLSGPPKLPLFDWDVRPS